MTQPNKDYGKVGFDQAEYNSRELVSKEQKTITVGTDVATNQEAIDMIPHQPEYEWTIDMADEPDTDLYVPKTIAQRVDSGTGSETWMVRLDMSGGERLNSLFIDHWYGMGFQVLGGEITGFSTARDNEEAAIIAYGCPGRILLQDVTLSGDYQKGIVSYSSNVSLNGTIDLGTPSSTNLNVGLEVKHGGQLVHKNGDITGTMDGAPVARVANGNILLETVSATSTTGRFSADDNEVGFIGAPSGFHGPSAVVNDTGRVQITGGSIPRPVGMSRVDPETDGTPDTLEQIESDPSEYGKVVTLQPKAGEQITVSHLALADNTNGGIALNRGDRFVMDDARDAITLVREASGVWSEVSRRKSNPNVGCYVTLSANQTFADGSLDKIQYDNVNYDHRGEFDTGTNEFSPVDDGFYQIEAGYITGSNVPDQNTTLLTIDKNGSIVAQDRASSSGSNTVAKTASITQRLLSGDSVSCRFRQQTGGDLDLSGEPSTFLTVSKIDSV